MIAWKKKLVVVFLGAVSCSSAVGAETLSTLVSSALMQHPSIRAQQGRLAAAKAGVENAEWQYWPTPSISTERASAGSDPQYTGDKQVTILRLQQPLWTGGRLSANLGKAKTQEIAQKLDSEVAANSLAIRVIQTWSEMVAARSSLQSYLRSKSTHERLLKMVVRRYEQGVSAKADVDLAQSRLESVNAEYKAALWRSESARQRMATLVGRSVGTQEELLFTPQLLSLDAAIALASETNPQILKAETEVKLAEYKIELARAAMKPEVYVRAERQYGNYAVIDSRPQNRVFIGLSTAFGPGLSNASQVEAANNESFAAKSEVQAARLSIEEQLRNDMATFNSASERRALLEGALSSNSRVAASWERQFLAGKKQWQDIMNAARDQAATEAQIAEAIGSQQLAGWRFVVLTQGLSAVINN